MRTSGWGCWRFLRDNLGNAVNFRKCVLALSVAVFLTGSMTKSNALPADPVIFNSSITLASGGWAAVTIIGVAGVLCAYDLVLKFQGVKNWDGTPKKLKPAKR